jgi:4-hydroxy-tetrahydrodipicolinate synthase
MLQGSDVFRGCMPALMTPCRADRSLDHEELVRTAQRLVATGMSAVVYCGSMGDWPLLTDEERQTGVRLLVAAGVPVVVGTGAQNPRAAAAHAAHARKVGAAGLMVIPRLLSRGSAPAAQKAHFEEVLTAGGDLPAVIYNSPFYGFQTRADLFTVQNVYVPGVVRRFTDPQFDHGRGAVIGQRERDVLRDRTGPEHQCDSGCRTEQFSLLHLGSPPKDRRDAG